MLNKLMFSITPFKRFEIMFFGAVIADLIILIFN
jgi:hypothetical protein